MQTKRVGSVDLFRAFGILCMVMGHIDFGDAFSYYIHAFHMPMFFFLSGFFFHDKGKPFVAFVTQKAKSLLVPYAVFSAFYLGFDLLRNGFSVELLKHDLYHFLWENTDQLPIGGALWFLTALFFTDVLFMAIFRLCKSVWVRISMTVCLGTFGCAFVLLFPFRLPWAADAGMAGLIFYQMGNCFAQFKTSRVFYRLSKPWVFLPILACNMALIFLNGPVNMREGNYAIIPLSWLNALLAILGFWYLFAFLDARHSSGILCKIFDMIQSVGRDSIVYLVTNQIVIWFGNKICKIVSIPVVPRKLLMLVYSFAVMYGIAQILTKTKLCVLIGKKPEPVRSS